MERIIEIDGKQIPFKATAAIPRLYRIKFGRDIMQDMVGLKKAIEAAQKKQGPIPVKFLNIFENVCFLMAKHADPEMEAKTADEWLDGFGTFSIYAVYPQLMELWQANICSSAESKKKRVPSTGR